VATNVVFETVSPGVASNPAISLRPEEARNLMDELWRAGVRPSEVGSPGQLKATERHLEDMRTLTFKLIDQKETV